MNTKEWWKIPWVLAASTVVATTIFTSTVNGIVSYYVAIYASSITSHEMHMRNLYLELDNTKNRLYQQIQVITYNISSNIDVGQTEYINANNLIADLYIKLNTLKDYIPDAQKNNIETVMSSLADLQMEIGKTKKIDDLQYLAYSFAVFEKNYMKFLSVLKK